MRKEYSQAVRLLFKREMTKYVKGFVGVKVVSPYIWPGERAFERRLDDRTVQWVVLSPSDKEDSFNVEVGWSRKGRFPALDMRPSPIPLERAEREEEYLCRLGKLAHGTDFWWVIERAKMPPSIDGIRSSLKKIPSEVARERVQPAVANAISLLNEVGIPFLNQATR